MACTAPLRAWQRVFGSQVLVFKMPRMLSSELYRELKVPCGRCLGCHMMKVSDWAARCVHELRYHKQSSYVTLTYSDEHLPENGALCHRDFQLFMKRLRKAHPEVRIAYLMCGEYGDKTMRPHYHALLFGIDFPDKKYLFTSNAKQKVYTSEELSRIWKLGQCSVGHSVTYQTAAYVAKYSVKRVTGAKAKEHYERTNLVTGEIFQLPPEYIEASRNPALGARYFEDHFRTMYSVDNVIVNKKEVKVPKYYDRLYERVDPDHLFEVKVNRRRRAELQADDNTPARLRVKAECMDRKYRIRERGKFEEIS